MLYLPNYTHKTRGKICYGSIFIVYLCDDICSTPRTSHLCRIFMEYILYNYSCRLSRHKNLLRGPWISYKIIINGIILCYSFTSRKQQNTFTNNRPIKEMLLVFRRSQNMLQKYWPETGIIQNKEDRGIQFGCEI